MRAKRPHDLHVALSDQHHTTSSYHLTSSHLLSYPDLSLFGSCTLVRPSYLAVDDAAHMLQVRHEPQKGLQRLQVAHIAQYAKRGQRWQVRGETVAYGIFGPLEEVRHVRAIDATRGRADGGGGSEVLAFVGAEFGERPVGEGELAAVEQDVQRTQRTWLTDLL